MNALHSPVCFAETGLLPCPAEKKAAKLAATLNHHTFSGPVSQEESLNSTDFSLFQSNPGGFLCTADCMAEREGFELSVHP